MCVISIFMSDPGGLNYYQSHSIGEKTEVYNLFYLFKNKQTHKKTRSRGLSLVVDHVLTMCKALGSISVT